MRPSTEAELRLRETLPLVRPPESYPGIEAFRPSDDPADQTTEMPLNAFLGLSGSGDAHSEVSGWGTLLLRRRGSFFRQVFMWLMMMSLLMSVGSGAIYYSRQSSFIEKDRQQRAHLLLGYLATQSQIGAYARDWALLSHPVRRMAEEEDVVFVAIYDVKGNELIKMPGRGGTLPSEPAPGLLASVLHDGARESEKNKAGTQDLLAQGLRRGGVPCGHHQGHRERRNCRIATTQR